MGVLVVSGCTSNGGRALHVAVISDKKKGGLSASFGAQTRTSATGRFCEQATIFFFRHLAVENALERGSRWGIETLALAPFSAQFFYASLLVRTSPSLSSAW